MRKLHLGLAEWREEHRLADTRAYYILRSNYGKEAPEPGSLFPTLAAGPAESLDPADDLMILDPLGEIE